ncbi:RNA polymerase factor sigma-54 [Bacillus carboniphilus]|uniref:RNA polymerase factor sigma-54 n=1 Tax=Bacillus carboniphilus TaxID=86663 RepID=A0ABN0VV75_9BACI
MEPKVSLVQKQSVKLSMTQELQQAIALLQYSSQELISFLEEKTLDNPLIQLTPPSYTTTRKSNRVKKDSNSNWIEQLGHKEESLSEHLLKQLVLLNVSQSTKQKIHYLIDSLDDNGYLTIQYEDMKNQYPNMTESEWDYCVSVLQALEPNGVGARSLQECLMIQMKRNHFSEQDTVIIEFYFDSFANKKWKQIEKELNIPLQEIQNLADNIQTLHPRPGLRFKKEESPYIIPDFLVWKKDGKWQIQLVQDHIPNVQYHSDYYRTFAQHSDASVQEYLKHCTGEYNWLKKSLKSRKWTLERIMTTMVARQEAFFERGPAFIRPLSMREVADELHIHESTVSRAVRGKFFQTNHGTFPLKSLFSAAVGNPQEDQSTEQVKQALLKLIETEDKLKPLSDQQIVDLLHQQYIKVSRRTIAKYRDQLGILPSSKRKQYR